MTSTRHPPLSRLSQRTYGVLSQQRADYQRYGVIARGDAGGFLRIDEKPPAGRYGAAAPCSIGAYKFAGPQSSTTPLEKTARGEYEITDYMTALAQERPVAIVESPFWLPIGDPGRSRGGAAGRHYALDTRRVKQNRNRATHRVAPTESSAFKEFQPTLIRYRPPPGL